MVPVFDILAPRVRVKICENIFKKQAFFYTDMLHKTFITRLLY